MKTRNYILFFLALSSIAVNAQKAKTFKLSSPDGNIQVTIDAGAKLQWSATHQSQIIIATSTINLQLKGGEILGDNAIISSSKTETLNNRFAALNYKKDSVTDKCNQLTLNCKPDYGIIFRAYNDGVVYRFFTKRKDKLTIQNEEANFNFVDDDMAFIPYANDPHNHDMYEISFENNYQHIKLSQMVKDTVAFAPVLVELNNGKKAVITEADLEDYPGMFLQAGKTSTTGLSGRYAPFPTEEMQGGHNDLQSFVNKRADYIATTEGTRNFPWRVVIISASDKELLNNDMVYRLASPSRLQDHSWIRPGKVAWDWWNDWNISHVDFRAGINTDTYKYYIDFASSHHIEYILLDEGWADSKDIMKIVPAINLQEIIAYGKQKNVGVWLWGGWLPLDKQSDKALSYYSELGIKGFKVDFMDRDDQEMVQFYYRFAKKAAEYKLMVDFHGAYKPTGLQRTFPNVVNFEGVRGMENTKWSNTDFPGYDVTIPYIRMIAGPLDYTPGAMKNANKNNYRAIFSAPMSQGTRCHQLAMYVMYEAPFEMLSDNPTNYLRESESVEFMTSVPTTFDETVALGGQVSQYAVMARRKGNTWYVGAMSNWDVRDFTIDFSFLGEGNYEAVIFRDGINADREATDYKKTNTQLSSKDKITIHCAPGGGWAARISKIN